MKIFVLASLLFVSSITSATGTPAEVLRIDFSGQILSNFCNLADPDPVMVSSGILTVVVRADFGGDVNGVHIVNKAVGSFRGIGLASGDEYLVNVAAASNFFPMLSISNTTNGATAVNFVAHVEIINLSNPGSGISQLQIIIVFVRDGTGSGENKVLEVSMNCVGN